MKSNLLNYIYLKDQRVLLGLMAFAIIGSSILGFYTPKIIENLYQSFSADNTFDRAIFFLIVLFVGEYFFTLIYQLVTNKYVAELIIWLRTKNFGLWLYALENHGAKETKKKGEEYSLGEVISRLMNDTGAVIEMVASGGFKIFVDIVYIVSCLIGFVLLNTTSGVFLIILEVSACILLLIGSKKMMTVYMEVRKSTGVLSRVLADLAKGFPFTYFHPHQNYASKRGEDSFEDFLRKQLKANVWDASYFSIAESLFPIILAFLVLIFPYSQIVEMAVLAAIIDLIQRSITPIKEITGKISSIQRARTGIERLEEFSFDLGKMPVTKEGKKTNFAEISMFELNLPAFTYPTRGNEEPFSLLDINITAKTGDLIGLVGQSGCGKSTLLKILSTDIMAESAQIKMEGSGQKLDFQGGDLGSLLQYKHQVGIVSQDSHVFTDTLEFNISMGQKSTDEFGAFWNKVKEDIPYLKTWGIGPESIIKPKELSLGQKQLLSALRSCFLAKPIVLFDEISSGLDSELEESLRKLVLFVQRHSLTFIVAHRIETIINATQILVMENGKIISRGNHNSLQTESDTYKEFISQLNG